MSGSRGKLDLLVTAALTITEASFHWNEEANTLGIIVSGADVDEDVVGVRIDVRDEAGMILDERETALPVGTG